MTASDVRNANGPGCLRSQVHRDRTGRPRDLRPRVRLILSSRCQQQIHSGFRAERKNVLSLHGTGWWSQTGSNRRHRACKARALPAELWPQLNRRRQRANRNTATTVVGLGRFELPTSRLSSARSNQLSYRPESRAFHEKKEKRRRRSLAFNLRFQVTNPETRYPSRTIRS